MKSVRVVRSFRGGFFQSLEVRENICRLTEGDPHDHVLRTLNDFLVASHQVSSL